VRAALEANVSPKLIRQAVDNAIDEAAEEDRAELIALMRGTRSAPSEGSRLVRTA
jgi:hypothetical protein